MTDEERVLVCQQEIRRLRGNVREQAEEIRELKKLFWSITKGLVSDNTFNPEMLYSALIMSEGTLSQHELLKKLITEERECE